jgi:hypothetical protein
VEERSVKHIPVYIEVYLDGRAAGTLMAEVETNFVRLPVPGNRTVVGDSVVRIIEVIPKGASGNTHDKTLLICVPDSSR